MKMTQMNGKRPNRIRLTHVQKRGELHLQRQILLILEFEITKDVTERKCPLKDLRKGKYNTNTTKMRYIGAFPLPLTTS